MTLALYYQPSCERLQDRIKAIAPDLDLALFDEQGRIFYQGKEVTFEAIKPQYFWIHAELFKSSVVQDYFKLMLESADIKWLHTINTGMDVLPYAQLLHKGVIVTNNHGQAIAIAEYVFAQVLAHYQQVQLARAAQQQKEWKFRPFREISGSKWLIIGFGHIGQSIAQRAKAFGVEVTAVRRSNKTEGLADLVVQQDALAEVLPKADVVVLACTSTDATRNMVAAEFLAAMKPGSVLVNIARGDLVDESALHSALDAGTPAYAILDVFREEPLPAGSWIWEHPRIAMTPHSSNAGSGMRGRSEEIFLENLKRIEAGVALLNQVSSSDIK